MRARNETGGTLWGDTNVNMTEARSALRVQKAVLVTVANALDSIRAEYEGDIDGEPTEAQDDFMSELDELQSETDALAERLGDL